MKSNVKRIAALVMAVLLVLSMMPGAMAAEYYSGSLSVGGRVKKPTPQPTEAPVVETATPEPQPTEAPAEETAEPEAEEPVEAETPVEEPTEPETEASPAEPEVIPEATEEPVEEEAPETVLAVVYKSGDDPAAMIRSKPDADSDRVGKAYHGDVVTVMGEENGWYNVDVNGTVGWMSGKLLSFDLSVIETPEPEVEEEVVEEPVIEEVVTEEPVVEETETEATPDEVVEETVTEEPVIEETETEATPDEVVEEIVTEEPVVEENETEATPDEVVEETVTEEPVVEETETEATPDEVVEETVTEEPVVEETETEATPDEIVEEIAEEETDGLEAVAETEAAPIELTNATVEYLVDENGEQILDAYGNPIQVITFDPIENVAVSSEANIRLEGDGLSEITQTIPADATVTVLAIEGDWVKVSVDGAIGYIYIDEIESMKNVTGLPETEEEETEDAEEDPTKNFKVTIFTSRRSVMAPGETITLTSKVEGFENFETLLQWECDKGSGFEPISGANGDSYSYEASKETLSYSWRLTVYYR